MSEVSGDNQSGDHSPGASSQPGVGFAEPGAGEEMADNEDDGDVDDHDHEEENWEEDDVDDESEDWGWRQFIPSFLRDQRHPSPFGFHFINLHLLLSRKVIVVFATLLFLYLLNDSLQTQYAQCKMQNVLRNKS